MYKIGKRFGVGIFVGDIFWGRYFIGAALLVGLYKIKTSNMAAQFNAPLRSRRHTMMDGFIYCKNFIRIKYYNVYVNILMCFVYV